LNAATRIPAPRCITGPSARPSTWRLRSTGSSRYGRTGWTAPAVTSSGDVIAEKKTSSNIFLVKLKESDGSLIQTSPPLAQDYFNGVSSPAFVGDNIYTTVSSYPAAGRGYDVTVLNLADLTVKATAFGSGSEEAPPYVRSNGVYFGSTAPSGATVFKLSDASTGPSVWAGNLCQPEGGYDRSSN